MHLLDIIEREGYSPNSFIHTQNEKDPLVDPAKRVAGIPVPFPHPTGVMIRSYQPCQEPTFELPKWLKVLYE